MIEMTYTDATVEIAPEPGAGTPEAEVALGPEAVAMELTADRSEPALGATLGEGGIHGDPSSDVQWAQTQSQDGYCVPVSVAMIATEATGTFHGEAEVVQYAVSEGLLRQDPMTGRIGTDAEAAKTMLEHFGVPADVERGADMDTLRDYLDEGRGVIVAVDAQEVWYRADDDAVDGRPDANHALVITGIDDTRGVVTLNDPGNPTGAGYEMSIQAFEDAWADSGSELVVTEAGSGEASAFPLGDGDRTWIAEPRYLLPLVVGGGLLAAALRERNAPAPGLQAA